MSMTNDKPLANPLSSGVEPVVRDISLADLKEVLQKGYEDFKAKPSHLILLLFIYPIVSLFVIRISAGYDILPLIFPLLAGFALIGPVAAIGLYELSRRREQGRDLSFIHTLDPVRSPSFGSIFVLSVAMMGLYFAWLAASQVLWRMFFGNFIPTAIEQFIAVIFTTAAGWGLIIVGSAVGFVFAVVVLAISAISFPMLLDRDVGVFVAVQTSIRAVAQNPIVMATWGFIVAGGLILGAIPLFVGLAVVMPVLGHATWHLYRTLVQMPRA